MAEACANTALLEKIQDPTYIGNETLTINGSTCTIRQIMISSGNYLFESSAIYKKATTNIRITANNATFAVLKWEELAKF